MAQFLRYWTVPCCDWTCEYWTGSTGDHTNPEQDIAENIRELTTGLQATRHDMICDLGYIISIGAGIHGQLRHLRQQRGELRHRQYEAQSTLLLDMSSEYPRNPYVRALGHMVHRYQMVRTLWLPWTKAQGLSIWCMITGPTVLLFLNRSARWVLEHTTGVYIRTHTVTPPSTTISLLAGPDVDDPPIQISRRHQQYLRQESQRRRLQTRRHEHTHSMPRAKRMHLLRTCIVTFNSNIALHTSVEHCDTSWSTWLRNRRVQQIAKLGPGRHCSNLQRDATSAAQCGSRQHGPGTIHMATPSHTSITL